jgi:MFS family permease
MLIYNRQNHNISRNLDQTFAGFISISNKKNENDQNFTWNINLFKDLIAVYSSILLSAFAYGIMMVLIATRLEANVKNEILISLSTIFQIGAGVIFSNFLPSFGRKYGLIKTIIIATTISSICTILLYKFVYYWLWIAIIYCYGTALFSSSIARNIVMIDLTPKKIRPIVISISITIVASANGMGPILLNLLNIKDSIYSFLLASFLYLLSIIPLNRLKKNDSIIRDDKKIPILNYIKNSPKIFFSGFTFSYIMSSCSAFSIIYGIKAGMDFQQSSMLLSALLFGTIFYIPLSFLCNIFNCRFIIITSSLLSLFTIYFIYFHSNIENIYVLFFILFALVSGIKLPTLLLINNKYKSTQRLIVNSAFTKISLIGVITGLINTGICMKLFGYNGIWISCGLILSLFIIFWFLNYLYKFYQGTFLLKNLTIFNNKSYDKEEEL